VAAVASPHRVEFYRIAKVDGLLPAVAARSWPGVTVNGGLPLPLDFDGSVEQRLFEAGDEDRDLDLPPSGDR
jgi:hypothetical protein